MALIHELQVSHDDRDECRDKVRYLVQMYQNGNVNNTVMKRAFNEWEGIMKRLKRGEELIEKNYREIQGNPLENAHFCRLGDLYFLLTKMAAIYDGFFLSVYAEMPEMYERARQKIDEVA